MLNSMGSAKRMWWKDNLYESGIIPYILAIDTLIYIFIFIFMYRPCAENK